MRSERETVCGVILYGSLIIRRRHTLFRSRAGVSSSWTSLCGKTEENSGLCLFICGSDFERIPKRALRTLTCEKRDFTKDGMIDSVCDLTSFLSLCEESYSAPRGRSFSEKSSERVYFYFLDSYRSI